MKITVSMMLAALGLSLAACGGPVEEDPSAELFSETAVSWNADGSPRVTTRWVTAAEQQATNRARAGRAGAAATETGARVSALTVDPNCSDPSIWLNDKPGQLGNRLCLLPGPVDPHSMLEHNELIEFPRPVSICTPFSCRTVDMTWYRAVRSYWDPTWIPSYADRYGEFIGTPGSTNFAMDGLPHEADARVRSAETIVTLIPTSSHG